MLVLLLAVPPLGMVAAIIITLRLAKKKAKKTWEGDAFWQF